MFIKTILYYALQEVYKCMRDDYMLHSIVLDVLDPNPSLNMNYGSELDFIGVAARNATAIPHTYIK